MKEYYLILPNGTMISLKGKDYDDVLSELDNTISIINDSVTYYLGYSDDTVIEELKEAEVNFEVIDND